VNERLVVNAILIAVVAGGLVYRHFFNRDARIKRSLGKVPRGRIGSAVEGRVVKVVGRLDRLGEPLIAPLSGCRCVHYELIIEEWVSSGRSGQWKTVVHDAKSSDFLMQDGSGTALVRTADAEVAVHKDEHHASGTFNDPTPELQALLERYELTATGWLGLNRKLRYREGVLDAGEHVAVCGAPTRWRGPRKADAAVLSERPPQWVFEHRSETPLYVSDDPAAILKPRPGGGRKS
jgi:hypothetical protein